MTRPKNSIGFHIFFERCKEKQSNTPMVMTRANQFFFRSKWYNLDVIFFSLYLDETTTVCTKFCVLLFFIFFLFVEWRQWRWEENVRMERMATDSTRPTAQMNNYEKQNL